MAVATPHSIERSSVIISVFSTTPGIGKTITAINLAAGLAHEGYKVCLADLDLQFGDVLNSFLHEYDCRSTTRPTRPPR